jgi:hypothetical protein
VLANDFGFAAVTVRRRWTLWLLGFFAAIAIRE